jgi:hypothetical protein
MLVVLRMPNIGQMEKKVGKSSYWVIGQWQWCDVSGKRTGA